MCFGFSSALSPNNPYLEQGDQYFSRRAEGAQGDRAQAQPIITAISLYNLALTDSTIEPLAATKILKSYYFQGCYAFQTPEERLEIHTRAVEFGKRYHAKYPNHPGIGYWYAVNLALWAKEKGPLKAIQEGVAEQIKNIAETALAMSQMDLTDKAGAYQILGRMHQLLPRIPLLLNWPDKKLAELFLRKSIEADSSDLTSHLFLAELLRDQGRHLEAARLVAPLLKRTPRPSEQLEDSRNLWKLQELSHSLRLTKKDKLALLHSYPSLPSQRR